MDEPRKVLSALDRVRASVTNIRDANEEQLGYVRSILHAIAVLAGQDSENSTAEIASLAKCARWIADDLESIVDDFGDQILHAAKEANHV
jgi:hypothetical protein